MKGRNSQNSKSPKRPLGYRLGRSLRAAGDFGRDAVTKPNELPHKAHGFFRRWFRKVWSVRGGGLYAVGYALTFIYFETLTLAGEISGGSGVGDFFREQVAEFFMRFATDTIQNMVKSFIWPIYVIDIHPLYGGIALGLAFWLFPVYLKKPIEKWLFADDGAEKG